MPTSTRYRPIDGLIAAENDGMASGPMAAEKFSLQSDGTYALVVGAASLPGPFAWLDKSIATAVTVKVLAVANAARKWLAVKNDSAIAVWINLFGSATAVAGGGNIRIAPNGGYFETPATIAPTNEVTIIAESGTPAVTAMEA